MEYLKGKITSQENTSFIFEVNNIGYKILGTIKNSVSKIYTHKIKNIRTAEETIYGFETQEEKMLFSKLNGIKGFGPKSAVKLISKNNISKIEEVMKNGEVHTLDTDSIKPSLISLLPENKNLDAEVILIKQSLKKYGFSQEKINLGVINGYKPNSKIEKNILNIIKEINITENNEI